MFRGRGWASAATRASWGIRHQLPFFALLASGLAAAAFGPRTTTCGAGCGLLLAAIPAFYYLVQTGERSAGMFAFFVAAPLRLLLEPSFYTGWARLLNGMFGLTFLMMSLMGPLVFPRRGRALLLGLWVGY